MKEDRNPESDREHSRPTQEVGSEGGSPGDLDLEHDEISTGSESTRSVTGGNDVAEERDRQLTRDDRPRP